ncbi:MAG: hypothetical protein RLZZ179_3462, partial [Verrucomicrobiota bacterium]
KNRRIGPLDRPPDRLDESAAGFHIEDWKGMISAAGIPASLRAENIDEVPEFRFGFVIGWHGRPDLPAEGLRKRFP